MSTYLDAHDVRGITPEQHLHVDTCAGCGKEMACYEWHQSDWPKYCGLDCYWRYVVLPEHAAKR